MTYEGLTLPQDLHSLRIALADDDDVSLRYTELMLNTIGHQVVVRAQDGEELIAGCAQQRVDLILADIRMPNVDGIDAIRTIYARQPVPVILISGYIDREMLDRARRELILAYLIKPLKLADLTPTITTAMRRFADIQRLRRDAVILSLARSESLRLVAAGIASQSAGHFRNIMNYCHLLETYTSTDERAQRLLESIRISTDQISRIATALHEYTGANIRDSVPLSLTQVVAESKELAHAITKELELGFDLAPDLPLVEGDANKIKESLLALVINGLEAHGPGKSGRLEISTGAASLTPDERDLIVVGTAEDDCEYSYLEVRDFGVGMDRTIVRRMFDPFFTTKFLGRGLGLPAVAGVVRSHGGVIVVESAPGTGTRVRL